MIRQLLDEAHNTSLDEASRQRLHEIYARSIDELSDALSEDLREELDRLVFPFLDAGDAVPTEAELRIAQAQLIGWLEGLFHGIQATLFAQQMAARQQLEQMRGQLPPGAAAATRRQPTGHLPVDAQQRSGLPGRKGRTVTGPGCRPAEGHRVPAPWPWCASDWPVGHGSLPLPSSWPPPGPPRAPRPC